MLKNDKNFMGSVVKEITDFLDDHISLKKNTLIEKKLKQKPVMRMYFYYNDTLVMKSLFYDCAFDYRKFINDVKENLDYTYVLIKTTKTHKEI